VAHTLTTCTFCGVGCGLYLESDGRRCSGVYPSLSHPTNRGRICARGWHVHEVASSPDRLLTPLLRRDGQLQPATWEEALDFLARRMLEIRERHGPGAFGFFTAARSSNEESYLLQKLARSVIGTNNIDHGTGPYCNNGIDVLLDLLGVPATTHSLDDLTHSEAIVVDGVDLGTQMPTVGGIVMRAHLAGAKLIVIDPRRHRVAEHADYFLQLRPGTDLHLYGAIAKVILDRGLIDRPFLAAHCRDVDACLEALRPFDLLRAAEVCGVAAEAIEGAALAYARARSAAVLFSTGVEARSEDSLRSLVNLVLLTGNVARPGGGLFALTEHNNLQGICDMGLSPARLPGYRAVSDPVARGVFEKAWRCRMPSTPGIGAREAFETIGPGGIRAAWLSRYDPVVTATFCDAASALRQLDLVVVQHLFRIPSCEHAHVVLPVVAYGEEEVTFTSTERRVQLARKVMNPPDGPIPAWQQLVFVARSLGANWVYGSSARVMDEIAAVVPEYSGVSYDNLGRDYGRQWPCTKDKPLGTRALFEDGIVGRPFRLARPAPPPEVAPAPAAYPYALIFGHSLYYWHQNVLIQHSETLRREFRVLLLDYPEGFVEINADDAAPLRLRDGSRIRLVSEQGTASTIARVTREVRRGTIFVPFFVREVERQILGQERFGQGNLNQPVCVRLEPA
jgi:formate dehydrogenase major subunit/formate dehydrogenase alpha subunit